MMKRRGCHSEQSEESHVFNTFNNTDSSAKASEGHCETVSAGEGQDEGYPDCRETRIQTGSIIPAMEHHSLLMLSILHPSPLRFGSELRDSKILTPESPVALTMHSAQNRGLL